MPGQFTRLEVFMCFSVDQIKKFLPMLVASLLFLDKLKKGVKLAETI